MIRAKFNALLAQWHRYSDRRSAAYDQQDTPPYAALDAAAERSGKKFAWMRDDLAEFCGCSAAFVTELLVCAVERSEPALLGTATEAKR